MNASCSDRDRIFEDGSAEEWAALEAHAANCRACAEEIAAWKAIRVAARELRDYRDSPMLWRRIERALAAQAPVRVGRATRWSWVRFWRGVPLGWQTALAGACVLSLTILAVVAQRPTDRRVGSPVAPEPLLKDSALAEVERTEKAYEQAIEKLAAEAKPELDDPATPLLANYREKLQVIDSAIEDLRAQAGMNPSNAHLRHQLLAMYQEKQQTLEEILEGKQR